MGLLTVTFQGVVPRAVRKAETVAFEVAFLPLIFFALSLFCRERHETRPRSRSTGVAAGEGLTVTPRTASTLRFHARDGSHGRLTSCSWRRCNGAQRSNPLRLDPQPDARPACRSWVGRVHEKEPGPSAREARAHPFSAGGGTVRGWVEKGRRSPSYPFAPLALILPSRLTRAGLRCAGRSKNVGRMASGPRPSWAFRTEGRARLVVGGG